jgi:pimeloyl-ACP methyl ester carboxylesterase
VLTVEYLRRSSHAEEKPPSFWTIDLMIAELLNVLQSFGIQDNFDIIGHSWGGMMAMETILRHGVPHGVGVPKSLPGLKHLVLVSAPANTTTSSKSVGERLATFPDWVRKGWTRGHSSPEFLEAYKVFDAVHKCRLKPQPPEHWINLNYSLKDKRLHEALCVT